MTRNKLESTFLRHDWICLNAVQLRFYDVTLLLVRHGFTITCKIWSNSPNSRWKCSEGSEMWSIIRKNQGHCFLGHLWCCVYRLYEKDKTINKEYHAANKAKFSHLNMLYHQDNVPAYMSSVIVAKLHELHFAIELLLPPPPTYTIFTIFSSKWLFHIPALISYSCNKETVAGQRFTSELNKLYLIEYIKKLEKHWYKWVNKNIIM